MSTNIPVKSASPGRLDAGRFCKIKPHLVEEQRRIPKYGQCAIEQEMEERPCRRRAKQRNPPSVSNREPDMQGNEERQGDELACNDRGAY